MKYWLDLFTPHTWRMFNEDDGIITLGEVPEAAIERVKELYGFENAILETKIFV